MFPDASLIAERELTAELVLLHWNGVIMKHLHFETHSSFLCIYIDEELNFTTCN